MRLLLSGLVMAAFSLATDVLELLKCQTTMLPVNLSFLTKRHPELLTTSSKQSVLPRATGEQVNQAQLDEPTQVETNGSCGLALLNIIFALRADTASVGIQSRCRDVICGRADYFAG